MNQLRIATVTENLRQFTALAADDAPRVLMVVGGKPATKLGALAIPDHNGVTAFEASFYPGDACVQEALAVRQRLCRPIIDDHRAFRLERAGDPTLARGNRIGVGEEPGASAVARKRL